ncbi:hypothetical protein [Pseudomonas sp. CGJS7]|uniref:hypothetical protein n=1 Tax=Pseudomonas sp. CGJS7 TaxID=3109348 RepID=UPI00300A955A
MSKIERRRGRQKGRKSEGSFLAIPHVVLRSAEFGRLNGWCVKLLVEMASAHRGNNNGDLSAAYSVLKGRGWNSSGTLAQSLRDLVDRGWLVVTRHGGRHKCALYAITWWAIAECPGKGLEVGPETAPRNSWRKTESVLAMRCNVLAMRCNEPGKEAA